MKMSTRVLVSSAAVVLAFVTTPALAQGGGGGGRTFDPAALQQQIRQSYLANYKTTVGFTDEEWTVVEPKMWRVLQLQVDAQSGGLGAQIAQIGGGGGGGRGGRGGGGRLAGLLAQAFATNGQPSAVQQKRTALQTALDTPDAAAQTVAAKLDEYRVAEKKAKEELLAAQHDLQSVVTVRQEALLVQLGFLD